MLDVLAMAFAETGDFTNAQHRAQNALDLANAAKMTKRRAAATKDWSFTKTTSPAENRSWPPTRR